MTPNLASQMRVAFSSMAWNTGSSSPGELEMTSSTSDVAVCCSSDSEIARARLQLVEQPRVLDRDHRLVGEVRDQLDLLVGEWPNLLAIDHDNSNQFILLAASVQRASVRTPPSSTASLSRWIPDQLAASSAM